jgi:hypothetical protein
MLIDADDVRLAARLFSQILVNRRSEWFGLNAAMFQ